MKKLLKAIQALRVAEAALRAARFSSGNVTRVTNALSRTTEVADALVALANSEPMPGTFGKTRAEHLAFLKETHVPELFELSAPKRRKATKTKKNPSRKSATKFRGVGLPE